MNNLRRTRGLMVAYIFAALGLIALLSVISYSHFGGILRANLTMSRDSLAIQQMQQSIRWLASQMTDAASDGVLKPAAMAPWTHPIAAPSGAGALPTSGPINKLDPWGTPYAYCAWAHGPTTGLSGRIAGQSTGYTGLATIAVISAGPGKAFDTDCAQAQAGVTNTNRVQTFTYTEAVQSASIWQPVGTGGAYIASSNPTGRVGVGTDSPTTRLDVAGAIRVGNDSAVCDATRAGAVRYNLAQLEVCNGSAWAPIGGGSISGTAAAPGIAVSGFSNSGLFNNSTDVIGLSIAGSERARFDANGLGVSAAPIAQSRITAGGSISATGADGNLAAGGQRAFMDFSAGEGRIGSTGGGGTATTLGIYNAAGTRQMVFKADGRVGVPSVYNNNKFAVTQANSAHTALYATNSATTASAWLGTGATAVWGSGGTSGHGGYFQSTTNHALVATAPAAGVHAIYATGPTNTWAINASASYGVAGTGSSVGVMGQTTGGYYGYIGYSSYSLYGNGNGYFAGSVYSGNYYYNSDIRLKTDIKRIENALARVRKIRGVEYTLKSSGERQLGVIAQEIEPLFPELVTTAPAAVERNPDGTPQSSPGRDYKAVSYAHMVGPLIEAVKELADKHDQLELTRAEQEKRLAAAEKEISELRTEMRNALALLKRSPNSPRP